MSKANTKPIYNITFINPISYETKNTILYNNRLSVSIELIVIMVFVGQENII